MKRGNPGGLLPGAYDIPPDLVFYSGQESGEEWLNFRQRFEAFIEWKLQGWPAPEGEQEAIRVLRYCLRGDAGRQVVLTHGPSPRTLDYLLDQYAESFLPAFGQAQEEHERTRQQQGEGLDRYHRRIALTTTLAKVDLTGRHGYGEERRNEILVKAFKRGLLHPAAREAVERAGVVGFGRALQLAKDVHWSQQLDLPTHPEVLSEDEAPASSSYSTISSISHESGRDAAQPECPRTTPSERSKGPLAERIPCLKIRNLPQSKETPSEPSLAAGEGAKEHEMIRTLANLGARLNLVTARVRAFQRGHPKPCGTPQSTQENAKVWLEDLEEGRTIIHQVLTALG
jgi:hypothetical protein